MAALKRSRSQIPHLRESPEEFATMVAFWWRYVLETVARAGGNFPET